MVPVEWEAVADAVHRLSPISLDDVLAAAELQTRIDRKYIVPLGTFLALLDRMDDELAALQIEERRLFRYESVYFDTPELTAYRQHAHGRRRRVKVRTRTYLDSGECLLEFKRVGARGETVKERYPYCPAARARLDDPARALAAQRVGCSIDASELRPVLTVAYRRATLVDPARGTRLTCDVDLRFEDRRGNSCAPLPGAVIVESKTVGTESPVDRVLRGLGRRPVPLSKYCVGMAILDPALPANRWNRELRQHFGWEPHRDRLDTARPPGVDDVPLRSAVLR